MSTTHSEQRVKKWEGGAEEMKDGRMRLYHSGPFVSVSLSRAFELWLYKLASGVNQHCSSTRTGQNVNTNHSCSVSSHAHAHLPAPQKRTQLCRHKRGPACAGFWMLCSKNENVASARQSARRVLSRPRHTLTVFTLALERHHSVADAFC